jgi:methylase of polypeptide subunit release factors
MKDLEKNTQEALNTINLSQQWEFPKNFEFDNIKFILYKDVFSPLFFKWSSIYIGNLPLKQWDSFLDMWCGCWIIWIAAYLKYNLKNVLCVDINELAIENTKKNIEINNLWNKISVVHSDVFSNVDKENKFDLIFWNAPYFDWSFDEKKVLLKAMYDTNYEHIKRFIIEGWKYLKKDGRLMIWFSTDKFPIEIARNHINEIWYDFVIYHQEKDILWYNQEILEIIKL